MAAKKKTSSNGGANIDRRKVAATKKSVPSKNKPGPWDDIARAGGAIKRTLYKNPGNKNQASNIDKWVRGGKYGDGDEWRHPSSGDIMRAVGKGAKAVGKKAVNVVKNDLKAADWAVRKLTPLPDRKPAGAKALRLMDVKTGKPVTAAQLAQRAEARKRAQANKSKPQARKK